MRLGALKKVGILRFLVFMHGASHLRLLCVHKNLGITKPHMQSYRQLRPTTTSLWLVYSALLLAPISLTTLSVSGYCYAVLLLQTLRRFTLSILQTS